MTTVSDKPTSCGTPHCYGILDVPCTSCGGTMRLCRCGCGDVYCCNEPTPEHDPFRNAEHIDVGQDDDKQGTLPA